MDYLSHLSQLTGDDWRTVSIVAQGILMILLVITGVYQLLTIRVENKRNRTLDICYSYTHNPLLFEAKRQLRRARKSGDLAEDPIKYQLEIAQLLNYYEAVAIGIERRIYNEEIVCAYLRGPIKRDVQLYLVADIAEKAELLESPRTYQHLLRLAKKWDATMKPLQLASYAIEIKRKPSALQEEAAAKNDDTGKVITANFQ